MKKLSLRIKVLTAIDGIDREYFRISDVNRQIQGKHGTPSAIRAQICSLTKEGFLDKPDRGVYRRSKTYHEAIPKPFTLSTVL